MVHICMRGGSQPPAPGGAHSAAIAHLAAEGPQPAPTAGAQPPHCPPPHASPSHATSLPTSNPLLGLSVCHRGSQMQQAGPSFPLCLWLGIRGIWLCLEQALLLSWGRSIQDRGLGGAVGQLILPPAGFTVWDLPLNKLRWEQLQQRKLDGCAC
eukprot:1142790-Pelagomonas_calceolata.AAC.1